MVNTKDDKRQSNIELMRIICMLLVVAHHYVVHGGALGISYLGETNRLMLYIVQMWPRVAINCFVLATGYFACNFDFKKSISKLKKLWMDRWLYSIIVSGFMIGVLGANEPTFGNVLKSVFPTLISKHNYVTSFIILYIFIPYINEAIINFSKETFSKLLICATVIFSLLPTCLKWTNMYTDNIYSYVFWMIYIYLIGAYLRKYKMDLPWKVITPIAVIAMLLIGVFTEHIYSVVPSGYFTNSQNSAVVLVVSVCVFNFFLGLNIKYSKVINTLAASSFAVLLIHDDPFVRNVLWSKIFSVVNQSNTKFLFLHLLISVIVIYVGCVVIDKIYIGIKTCMIKIIRKS